MRHPTPATCKRELRLQSSSWYSLHSGKHALGFMVYSALLGDPYCGSPGQPTPANAILLMTTCHTAGQEFNAEPGGDSQFLEVVHLRSVHRGRLKAAISSCHQVSSNQKMGPSSAAQTYPLHASYVVTATAPAGCERKVKMSINNSPL